MTGAVISQVRLAAAHDGVAELVLTLRHDNGGTSEVTLDGAGANALLTACGAETVEALVGQGWEKVRDALCVSWNRFNPKQNST